MVDTHTHPKSMQVVVAEIMLEVELPTGKRSEAKRRMHSTQRMMGDGCG